MILAYHAAHSASALWALIVPALVGGMAIPPSIARMRGWGDPPASED